MTDLNKTDYTNLLAQLTAEERIELNQKAEALRAAFMCFARRIAPVIAACKDPTEIRQILTQGTRKVLEEQSQNRESDSPLIRACNAGLRPDPETEDQRGNQ
jgi:hypothetical protein